MNLFEFVGTVFGQGVGFPPRPAVPLPAIDARTHALRGFKAFLATLEFRRAGEVGGDSIPFKVATESIHIEQPDDVKRMRFPSIAFVPGRASYEPFGLGSGHLNDDTFGVYAPGTVLLNQAEWKEVFGLDLWGSKRAERRAIKAGIEAAMFAFEESSAVTLRLPSYYDRTATFALVQGEVIDDVDTVRNRRRAHLYVQLDVQIVRLVNAITLKPQTVLVEVDDC